MSAPGLIVGNLDCEVEQAATGPALPANVLEMLSASATLLRVLARDGDTLWTPRPVDPSRVVPADGIPMPRLASGPLDEMPRFERVLAWGETVSVARRRLDGESIADAARAVNDRRFCLDAARRLGCELPGSCAVDDVDTLERHLRSGGRVLGAGGRWVVKAPFSAAGRSRLVGSGKRLDDLERRRVENLLRAHGALVFEPWLERVEDFGLCLEIDEGRTLSAGVHRLEVDALGGFTGIGIPADPGPLLTANERDQLEQVVDGVALLARAAGYRGPLGIDLWRYRDDDGHPRLHPLGEINARRSFGLVARAWRDAFVHRGELPSGNDVHLRFGAAAPAGSRMLLRAGEDGGAAWIEELAV